jgi:hypothetical protein
MAPTQTARTARSRRGLAAALTAAAAAATVACGGAAMAATPAQHGRVHPAPPATAPAAPAAAVVPLNCAAAPSKCGYPDATNTGYAAYSKAGVPLRAVPGQVSSGPGWHYDSRGWVEVTGNGANLSYLSIPYNVDITASNVTLNHDSITTSGTFGVSLRHTAGVTVENSTIRGTDAAAGRVNAAVSDVYGDSTAMTVMHDNISDFRIAVNMGNGGTAEGNYIHDPGYIAGDHTDGIMAGGSTVPTTIKDNTVFISLDQTDAITIDASGPGQQVANQTVEGNFLAGGDYALYAGAGNNAATSNIHIQNNRFAQQYFTHSGQFGADAYYNNTDPGNIWTGNIWDTTGQPVTP